MPDPDGMTWIPGGTFRMGSDLADYPEEGPPCLVTVDGFWTDKTPVTVAAYAAFVADTGYLTVAQRPARSPSVPGLSAEMRVPGSMVFRPADGPVDLTDMLNWWRYVPGADWLIRKAPAARWQAVATTPSCTSAGRTWPRSRRGPGRTCQPRRSGSMPPAAGLRAPGMPGETSWRRTGGSWRTPGSANSPGRTSSRRKSGAPPRWAPFPPTDSACRTSRATCGSGRVISTGRGMSRPRTRAVR